MSMQAAELAGELILKPQLGGVAEKGVNFIVTSGASPAMSILEKSLDAIETLVDEEEVVARYALQLIVTQELQPQPLR